MKEEGRGGREGKRRVRRKRRVTPICVFKFFLE